MKKGVITILLLGMLLISPLVQAQTQSQAYSGFSKFIDNVRLFLSSGDKKVILALEIREKELNSAINNLELGEENKAKEEIESAIDMLKIIQLKTTPEIADEVKNNIEETESRIKENENLNLEFFEKYLTEEQKTKLIIEHSEKIFDYCEELAKQDYELMLKDEKCQNNTLDWLKDEVNDKIGEMREQDSKEIKKQVGVSMNNPKDADCSEISLTTERAKCEKFKALAIRCEFQGDESACEEIRMFKDIQNDERENYEKEILDKYVPAECTEAGIRDGEKCKKYIIALYQPDSECMKKGEVLDNEACGKKLVEENKIPEECIKNGQPVSPKECEEIMKEKSKPSDEEFELMSGECKERGVYDTVACEEIMNLPRPCKDAGYYTKKECEEFTLKQNLPQECVNAGALTPEACEKLKLPQKCQGEAFSNEECEAVFIKGKMPPECQESGTYNFFKCAKLLYEEVSGISIEGEIPYLKEKGISLDEIPDACFKDSSRTNFERDMACDEALIKKFGIMLPPPVETSTIPRECMRGEIPVSPEECEEILGNGIIQNDLQDVIPEICREANAETPEECGKLLEKQREEEGIGIDMPEECIGIDVEECKEIMKEKNITIKKSEVNQVDDDMCEEGEENCKNDGIIKEGVPDECAKLGVYDKESCSLIMSKINAQRIQDGDKIVVDDDGNTDYITNDQINKIAGDSDKESDEIKPDVTKANEIKQEVNEIEDAIDTIETSMTMDEVPKTKDNEDVSPAPNIVDNDVAPGPEGIVGQGDNGNNIGAGDESSDSGEESAPITGEVIKDSNSNNLLEKIFDWLF